MSEVRDEALEALPFTATSQRITCTWEPRVPDGLTRQERRRYCETRDLIIARLADELGGGVAVIGAA
jgi:hypothetical protein